MSTLFPGGLDNYDTTTAFPAESPHTHTAAHQNERASLNALETAVYALLNVETLTRFVDYTNGNDANDGKTPQRAFKTVQAAYNNLKALVNASWTGSGGHAGDGKGLGVGTIVCLPGRHDLGSGLNFDSTRPVKLQGTRSGSITHYPGKTATTFYSSSASATEMCRLSHASAIGYGFDFHDIYWEIDGTINTAMTKIIYATKIGDLVVDHCSFNNADNSTNLSVTAVYHEDVPTSSGEGGWVRVTDNNVSRMQLYQCTTTTGASGGNFNRGTIARNVVFYGGSLAMIGFYANTNLYTVENNNLEGTAVAVEIGGNGSYTENTFINNSGEDPSSGTPTNPFYKLSGSVSQQAIYGGSCSSPSSSGSGTWISYGANAYRNSFFGVADFSATVTDHKRLISETSNSEKNSAFIRNMTTTAYTATNVTTDRAYDANATSIDELADVLGTLIADLRARGLVK